MTATPAVLRDAGMTQATDHAPAWKVAQIDALIARANASGQPWSSNTIRGQLPDTQSQGLVGARVRAAAMRRPREMTSVGFEPSDLPSTRAAMVRVWQGVA